MAPVPVVIDHVTQNKMYAITRTVVAMLALMMWKEKVEADKN